MPQVDARYRVRPIEDARDLLKSRSLGLNIEKEHKNELEEVPDLSAMTRVSPITLNQGREEGYQTYSIE